MSTKIQNENLVSEIVAQTAQQLAPINLRAYQAEVYKVQRARRTSGSAAAIKKMQTSRHRRRVRQPSVVDCNVADTRRSSDGRLYFELGNGQAVRADRVCIRTTCPGLKKFRKGRRLLPFANWYIWDKVAKEIEKNANRSAQPNQVT